MAAVSGHLWEIEDTDFVVEQVGAKPGLASENLVERKSFSCMIFFLIMQLNTIICQDRLGTSVRKRQLRKTAG